MDKKESPDYRRGLVVKGLVGILSTHQLLSFPNEYYVYTINSTVDVFTGEHYITWEQNIAKTIYYFSILFRNRSVRFNFRRRA